MAWIAMEKYNKYDVLALEELYKKLAPWDNTINFNLFTSKPTEACNCGSTSFQQRGYAVTTAGKYARYVCKECGHWSKGSINLFSKEKRNKLKRPV
jgi:hypothetical protein